MQVSPCGLPLHFPASFASPDHNGRLINKHRVKWSKKSESRDTSTKYVTVALFLGGRWHRRLKVNLMKTLLWEKGWDMPHQPGRQARNNGSHRCAASAWHWYGNYWPFTIPEQTSVPKDREENHFINPSSVIFCPFPEAAPEASQFYRWMLSISD